MNEVVEQIKRKANIVEYINSFVPLQKAGRNFKGLCPFHQEKSPSFIVSPDRQIWHCFGSCADGGDVIRFLMKWDRLTFSEAVKELAAFYRIPFTSVSIDDVSFKQKERLFILNRTACDFYRYLLNENAFGAVARSYIRQRNLKKAVLDAFELGYAPSSWDSLHRFLLQKKFRDEEMFSAGVVVKSENGTFYDRFRGRLIFPLKDSRGNIIGFSGRILHDEKKQAKYINSPETLLYHKRETLFGLNITKDYIRKKNCVIVVEGEFDMISLFQSGIGNVVAIKGSALTKEQLLLIKRFTNRIYLALDSDAAGEEAMKRGIEDAELLDVELGVIKFPQGKDPDEALHQDKEATLQAVRSPVPIYDFLIEYFQKKYPEDNVFSRKNIGEELLPFFNYIQNPIVLSYYIKKLAVLLHVSESSITATMRKLKYKKKENKLYVRQNQSQKEDRSVLIERHFLSLLLGDDLINSGINLVKDILVSGDFSYPSYKNLYAEALKQQKNNNKMKSSDFAAHLSPELRSVFDYISLAVSLESPLSQSNIVKLAFEIKRFSLKRRLQVLLLSDKIEDQEEMKSINGELKQLEKKLA